MQLTQEVKIPTDFHFTMVLFAFVDFVSALNIMLIGIIQFVKKCF